MSSEELADRFHLLLRVRAPDFAPPAGFVVQKGSAGAHPGVCRSVAKVCPSDRMSSQGRGRQHRRSPNLHYTYAQNIQRIQRAGRGQGRARVAAGESDRRVPPSSPADTSCSVRRLYCCTPLLPHRAHTSTLRKDDRTPQSSLTDRWLRSAAVGGRRVTPRREPTTPGGRSPPLHDGRQQNGDTMADGGPQKTATRWQNGGRR